MAASNNSMAQKWAHEVRENFVRSICRELPQVADALQDVFAAMLEKVSIRSEMLENRDAFEIYQRTYEIWLSACARTWLNKLQHDKPPGPQTATVLEQSNDGADFDLVDDAEMNRLLVVSRIKQAIVDQCGKEFDDLATRIMELQGHALADGDVLRPGSLVSDLVSTWMDCGMTFSMLTVATPHLQKKLGELFGQRASAANAWLIERGVLPKINLSSKIRIAGNMPQHAGAMAFTPTTEEAPASDTCAPDGATHKGGPSNVHGTYVYRQNRHVAQTTPYQAPGMPSVFGQMQQFLVQQVPGFGSVWPAGQALHDATASIDKARSIHEYPQQSVVSSPSSPAAAAFPPHFAREHPSTLVPSSAVIGILQQQQDRNATLFAATTFAKETRPIALRLQEIVRKRATDLKNAADSEREKAVIEVVALMFQCILSEERISPTVRIWFARLQVPVLRVALSDPAFLASEDHPARRLIDRMGACALGFDAESNVERSVFEREVQRVVQVIEQYPETGPQVFEVALNEFEAFLSRHLTQQKSARKISNVAQQVEEKEALTIQYTIELKKMLEQVPIPKEARQFLYQVWAEVLAISAVRSGAQSQQTGTYKKTVIDLLHLYCSKPPPHHRSKEDLHPLPPPLMSQLRQGMGLIQLSKTAQETHIKILHEALLSVTHAISISKERVASLAQRLTHLEDLMEEIDNPELLSLNEAAILELLDMGDDATVSVIADYAEMLEPLLQSVQWVRKQSIAQWFALDHNGLTLSVQYVWHSVRKQLHLFVAPNGDCYLFQLRRLAVYAQSGLLHTQETEEPLMQKASSDALAKLRANPERLLH